MSVAVHIPGSLSQPSGWLWGAQFIGRQGRNADRQGGMGAKPAMHLCGPALAPPMLAEPSTLFCTYFFIFHYFGGLICFILLRHFFTFVFLNCLISSLLFSLSLKFYYSMAVPQRATVTKSLFQHSMHKAFFLKDSKRKGPGFGNQEHLHPTHHYGKPRGIWRNALKH